MLPQNGQLDNHIKNNLIPSLVLLDKHLPDARLEPTSKRYKGSAGSHINSREDSVTITAAQLSAELQLGEVFRETNQGRKNIIDDIGGVRALTGKRVTYQGNPYYLVTVDLDGPNAQKELDGLMGDRQLPLTVAWTSGKPGRSTKLFKIPEGKHGGLKGKAKIGSKQDESEVEFHFTSSGSILPPSPHPETGSYKWLPGCSLDEIAIADLPDCLLEAMKEEPKANPIKSKDDIDLPVDQPIPLFLCLTKEVRALIESGVPEGSGHNDKALGVTKELVSVKRYLDTINQPFLDSPEILYNKFVENSGIEYGPKEDGRLSGAYNKPDNGPGCTPEGVNNCIRGWYCREHLKQNGAKFNNVTPINKHQKRDYQEPQKDLKQTLLELIEQDLDGSRLEIKLMAIVKDRKLPSKDVKNLYEVIKSEQERNNSRQDQKADLTSLINAGRQRLNLAEYLPEPLAKTLIQIAKIIGTTPEAFLTILLPTIAASSHPHNKLELIRETKFYASPLFWIAIVIESGGAKTPAMNQIIDPYKRLQYEEDQRFKEETKAYDQELQVWQTGTPEQKRHEAPPEKPKPPREYFVQDFTSEAIAKIQDNQPDCGFLIPLDELSALLNNQNAYRAGKGTDAEKLLSARDGSGIKVNRADGRRLSSPHSTYSIVGGIQPDLLRQQMGDHQDSRGHFARFSYCAVPILPAPFVKNAQIPDISEMLYAIYKELSSTPEGKLFKLSQTATDAYEDWFNELDHLRCNEPSQAMRAVYAKAKKQTGEIALLLHLLWAAFDKETPADWISLEITQAAIKLSAFYIEQIKAIYVKSDTTSLTPKLSRILELAERKGTITARIVKQSDRAFKNDSPETIRGYFTELVKMGLGSTRGKIASLSFSVDKVDNCRQGVDNCLQAENLNNKGIMTTTTSIVDTVDINLSPNATFTPPDTFISKVSTLSTDENQIPESHIQQSVDNCRQDVDGCLQMSTDDSNKDKNIVSPLVFVPGERVSHPSYGLGTMEEVDGEWYCLWDTLSGGQMRLITEDFQMMEKIA